MAPSGASRRALARLLLAANRRVTLANALAAPRRASRVQHATPHTIWSRTKTFHASPWIVSSWWLTTPRDDLGFASQTTRVGMLRSQPFSSTTKPPEEGLSTTASTDPPRTKTNDDSLLETETTSTPVNPRKDLYMMFTCGVCDTRAAKGFSRQAYENGVVIVRCPSCQNQHLVADHHGWFGEKGTIEDFLMEKGEGVAKGSADLPGHEHDGTWEIDEVELKQWMEKSGIGGGKE